MPATQPCFTSVKDLTPVFDHGGHVIFVELIIMPGSCAVRGFLPWEIVMRADGESKKLCQHYDWTDLYLPRTVLEDMKATLLHEFLHLYERSLDGYKHPQKLKERSRRHIAQERAIEEHVHRLLSADPDIVDDIMRELIMHPYCSIIFPDETRHAPFWTYYCSLVNELATKARNGMFEHGEAKRLKVLLAAEMAHI